MSGRKLAGALSASTLLCLLVAGTAAAQSDTATVTYEVQSITLLDVTGSASVTISTGVAGTGLTDATDAAGVTYAITNNAGTDSKKLIGKINTDMPSNTTLLASVDAPSGANSAGYVALTSTDADLVTGIDNVAESSLAIAFKLQATVAAGVVASAQKTFTLTVTN